VKNAKERFKKGGFKKNFNQTTIIKEKFLYQKIMLMYQKNKQNIKWSIIL